MLFGGCLLNLSWASLPLQGRRRPIPLRVAVAGAFSSPSRELQLKDLLHASPPIPLQVHPPADQTPTAPSLAVAAAVAVFHPTNSSRRRTASSAEGVTPHPTCSCPTVGVAVAAVLVEEVAPPCIPNRAEVEAADSIVLF